MARLRMTKTTNGAAAYKATGNKLVDLFFNIGASRTNLEGAKKDFLNAFKVDPLTATAILLWARDIRHDGAGEREVFRTILKEMAGKGLTYTQSVVKLVPEIGRFDDLKSVYGTAYEQMAVNMWASEIKAGNVLAAKWAKREDRRLQIALGMNEAGLRKVLAKLRKEHIVEAKMAGKLWSKIDYSKLPSIAGMRYAKAFLRNDQARYQAFMNDKSTKVNATTAFPYDVYRMYARGGVGPVEVQKFWDNLKDLGLTGSVLGMVDVSGSMWWPEARVANDLYAGDVGISLGVYTAQKCEGPFKDLLMTFASKPEFIDISKAKNVSEAFRTVQYAGVGGSTNIEAAYVAILDRAIKFKASPDQMPKYLAIYSDMQFNSCVQGAGDTVFQNMKKRFKAAGYELPIVIFWNMNASYGNFPTSSFEKNVAMVSGFSPNVLKAVLNAEAVCITPQVIMEEAIAPFKEMLAAA